MNKIKQKKNIESFSFLYILLRFYTRICFRLFYKNIVYKAWENVPKTGPLLFAPNHQNALMDALAVLLRQKRSLVFMARADMFRNKISSYLLNLIKIMPVYRIKDGYSKLSRNDRQFQEAGCVLINNATLCMMPEGGQSGHRRLRPLVKGIFRIAFEAQSAMGKSRDLRIIPVGIDYSEYEQAGSDLVVHFGKPLLVSDYMGFYEQDKALGINTLRDELSKSMQAQILHIQNDAFYHEILALSRLLTPVYLQTQQKENTALNRFEARRVLAAKLEDSFRDPGKKASELIDQFHFIDEFIPGEKEDKYCLMGDLQKTLKRKPVYWLFNAFMLAPVLILNFPIHKILQYVLKLDQDRQMYSSYRFALSALLLPIWYFILSVAAIYLFDFSCRAAMALFALFVFITGTTARLWPSFKREFKLWRFVRRQPADLRFRLISTLDEITSFGRDLFAL